MSAHEAHGLMTSVLGAQEAVRAICTFAAEGLVLARARKLVLGDVLRREVRPNAEIPAVFWRALVDNGETQDWTLGVFSSHSGDGLHIDSLILYRAVGVEFLRDDITGILPDDLRPKAPSRGRPQKYDWSAAADAVRERIKAGSLNPTQQADIERAMHDFFAASELWPGEQTVRNHAKLLWEEIG